MSTHIASYALIGVTGHRVGTRYIFKMEKVAEARFEPHFRFRNADCEVRYARWSESTPAGRSALQREGE